jgi:hypothetical protein
MTTGQMPERQEQEIFMDFKSKPLHGLSLALSIGVAIALSSCGSKEPPAPPAAAATPPAATAQTAPDAAQQAAAQPPQPLQASTTTWTPEAMEELLAPVALYPDPVLGEVLVASTNPQEVLDAGNWLLQNPSLQGKALDEAAKEVGFTPPVRGLLQSPEVIDMMCQEMGWTTELGQAYVNDQAGVLDAVQRLRVQAKDVGNLKSSDQMKVATEVQDGHEVITVSPPSPQVVYVPQYDPVAVYAPPPATAAAPATTTTTTTTGHSTGTLVATGLLSFGAGILVANIFDNDDDDWYKKGYYNPRYYGPPMPYYPPRPYYPRYGNGYYPSNGYNRPPGYGGRNGNNYVNNGNVVINTGGNGYWDHYDNNRSGYNGANRDGQSRKANSPITAAKPNRPELNSLNAQAKQGPKRPAPGPDAWKGQSSYAGAQQGAAGKVQDARPGAASTPSRDAPKVQGTYAGGQSNAADARSKAASAAPAAKPAAKAAAPNVSRPDAKPSASAARPAASDRANAATSPAKVTKPASKPAAMPSGAQERAKSAAPSGAKSGGDRAMPTKPAAAPAKPKGTAPAKGAAPAKPKGAAPAKPNGVKNRTPG